ncbi:hypothetical protein LCGC14_0416890 [marine sediment metagenome]|uniref:Zinc-ribbon domain-containing protein n=1 Tax=marine sediment metagenome TaxID=412755 RepID=A0A0F9SS91_9ZZZZ
MGGQCSTRVWISDWDKAQCSKKAVVKRDGKWYCKIHDPEYIKAKEDKRQARRVKIQCPKCGSAPRPWWAYCPFCGTKYPKH